MFNNNIILATDSYKASHFLAYKPGIDFMHSYIESRGGLYPQTVFFGPQMLLKNHFSHKVTRDNIEEAAEFFAIHGQPFNREGWETIMTEFGGALPLEIMAAPEGMIIPNSNVLLTVTNTDRRFAWLPQYIETPLLRSIWYPTTVATLSWTIKQRIKDALEISCDNPEAEINFRLHDFGARGASSSESASIGGAAHLVNFMGSDTLEGILAVRRFYGENVVGYSIPASEHSTVCSFGPDGETESYRQMVDMFSGPGKIFANVSDTYDLFNSIKTIWGGTLRDRVINNGGTLVIRPDSGDPKTIPVKVIEQLSETFGFTVNSKGYKVLPSFLRVIQGDGVDLDSIQVILKNLLAAGFSAENLAFGMGGALLHSGINRDTNRFAQKASAVSENGIWKGIAKSPVTDPGKVSKRGRLALVQGLEGLETVPLEGNEDRNILKPVWRNGELLVDHKFSEIRARSNREIFVSRSLRHSQISH